MEREQNLRKVQKFCQNDIRIKQTLYELAPNKNYMYSEDYRMELSDKTFEGLKYIKSCLQETLNDFGLEFYKPHLDELFHSYETQLAEAGLDASKLQSFYQKNLSDMRPEIVQETGETCVGYTFRDSEAYGLIQKTNTVNEFLHVIHSKIMNDNDIYQGLPIVGNEQTQENYTCTLYGVNTEVSNTVLQSVAAVKDIGDTDIMSLSEKQIVMMIRDKGHALMIQVNQNEDESFNVKYFIPKLCNQEMINNLKGVTPVNENSRYTIGSFDTSKENLGLELLHFVSNVPTDMNMNFGNENNTTYSDINKLFSDMDFPHLAKFYKANPILSETEGFSDYIEARYQYDLSMAKTPDEVIAIQDAKIQMETNQNSVKMEF